MCVCVCVCVTFLFASSKHVKVGLSFVYLTICLFRCSVLYVNIIDCLCLVITRVEECIVLFLLSVYPIQHIILLFMSSVMHVPSAVDLSYTYTDILLSL